MLNSPILEVLNTLKLMLKTILQRRWLNEMTEDSSNCGYSKWSREASTKIAVVEPTFAQPSRIISFACTVTFCMQLSLAIPNSVEAQESFRDCDDCPEMVVIPSGMFMMGPFLSEEGVSPFDSPRHRVTISYSFAVGKYEVTFREFDACVEASACSFRPEDEGWGRGNRPVINIRWYDAKEYVDWLSRETGEEYRLLSESEWEFVARAGTTKPFIFGSTISSDQANYDGRTTYGGGQQGIFREKTVPVGSFPSNGFGLHDVHGNVWELVEDCWHDGYDGAPVDGSAWIRGGVCTMRVVRGGSWYNAPQSLRSAARAFYGEGNRGFNVGFRVARTLNP